MTDTRTKYDVLETRQVALEGDIRGLDNRIAALDDKFDKVMTGFAEEFRAAITSLSSQFNERQKTPWGVLLSGASVVLAICITIGSLGLSPIQTRMSKLEEDLIPRKEVEFRDRVLFDRLNELNTMVKEQSKQERDRVVAELENLKRENAALLLRSSGGMAK